MEKPNYFSKYLFDWDLMDVVMGGKSVMDSPYFVSPMINLDHVNGFLNGYGIDVDNPIVMAELYGAFQEGLQYIRRYFLTEGNPVDGLDLKVPDALCAITNIPDLFLMATGNSGENDEELRLWAEVALKVMHVIVHIDRDIRSDYFSIIQTQVFDKFYKYIYRDENGCLSLGVKGNESIPLVDFVTKAKKSRDSLIMKLLHKAENVSEEIYDRVGIRFITQSKFDLLKVIKFLLENHILIPHNCIPKRSLNSIFHLDSFRESYKDLVRNSFKENLSEDEFSKKVEHLISDSLHPGLHNTEKRNEHSAPGYRSIQLTYRQLIQYENPFMYEFNKLREQARSESSSSELAKRVLTLETNSISKIVRFYYPFEIQVVDSESHQTNTEGEAAHNLYKQSQRRAAMSRVFKNLLDYKKIILKTTT